MIYYGPNLDIIYHLHFCCKHLELWYNYDSQMGNHLKMLGFTFSHLWKHVWILGHFSNSITSLCLSFGHKFKAKEFDWIQIWLNINSIENKQDANWWKRYWKSISHLHYLSPNKTTTWALNHEHWTQIFVHISFLTFILVNMNNKYIVKFHLFHPPQIHSSIIFIYIMQNCANN
jgi:hypothetical protein